MALPSGAYAPRDPAASVLYQIVRDYYETFRAVGIEERARSRAERRKPIEGGRGEQVPWKRLHVAVEVIQPPDPARELLVQVQTAESNKNAVNILGYSRHPELSDLVERVNKGTHGLELKLRYDNNSSNLLRRSDQWPFLQNGVPALWFHTGLHPDYHTQYDRPEKINYENPAVELLRVLAHRRLAALRDRGQHLVHDLARVAALGLGRLRGLLEVPGSHGYFP